MGPNELRGPQAGRGAGETAARDSDVRLAGVGDLGIPPARAFSVCLSMRTCACVTVRMREGWTSLLAQGDAGL